MRRPCALQAFGSVSEPNLPRPAGILAWKGISALLIIDSDLGFAFWVGHALDSAGYVSLPAQSARAATDLILHNGLSVDVVIVDPLSSDAGPFLSRLRYSHPLLKTVAALPESSPEAPEFSAYDAILRKPHHRSQEAAQEWVSLILTLSPPNRRTRMTQP